MTIMQQDKKRSGCSVLFLNRHRQILLLLRDDIPSIPYPGMWDLPGGHMDPGETPEQCIRREMMEEMSLELDPLHFFKKTEFESHYEHTFWTPADFDPVDINLMEGQCVRWFTRKELDRLNLVPDFLNILIGFYEQLVSAKE